MYNKLRTITKRRKPMRFSVEKWCSYALVLVRPNKRKSYTMHTTLDTHKRKHVRKTTTNAGRQGVSITGKQSAHVSGLRHSLTMFFLPSVLLAHGEKSVYIGIEQMTKCCRAYVCPVKMYDVLYFVNY